ncbi:MAG: hypothetical protein A2600_01625 [Candidatus Lambdaproteobacteria bacterium RIFOXYD1_FULL_56_27]|uniref:Pseudouridine synthase n=1 Tax=Candidatus Lambdaproteobacteria bacterium RIFOXYD2_FULL_56_26 TaxID=1817773 RepID=A0A1F6GMY7_9PROT|nr:MAG: hypothetical protein A2557_12805 [Candidatus Lambdaproteobacteria bacterium RIFOXYD2_FULL_56_26]OGH05546.1 MAG: hypothetical protein A2426_04415 [Candidatus Lambdaproteobacteria bacterium RIFOXYC1_FULL_56_13]OGH08505.1 MAG: hypothetical protein A2600_01625 [Candidatus Lambdaproteobacteria bacterium RIFOXYD1_FULL_56_27]
MQQFRYVRHQKKIESILEFLCRRFPYQDGPGWTQAIESGVITLDGQPTRPQARLENGQTIGYERERASEPPIDRSFRILYQDPSLLVVEKNGNIPIVESGRYYKNTLIEVLKEELGFEKLFQVHRLDKETSGVLVVAKSASVATVLGDQFAAGSPHKIYQAVLVGEMATEEVFVDQPIGKVKPLDEGTVRVRQVIDPQGKPSQSRFRRIKAQGGLSLVEVELMTGRTHQIRVHAEWLGLPVLGDKLYGQKDERFLALYKGEAEPEFPPFGRIDRQLLHASRLNFNHPVTGEPVAFESPCAPFFAPYPAVAPLFAAEENPTEA